MSTAPDAPRYWHCAGCDRPVAAASAYCPDCDEIVPAYLHHAGRPWASFDGACLPRPILTAAALDLIQTGEMMSAASLGEGRDG